MTFCALFLAHTKVQMQTSKKRKKDLMSIFEWRANPARPELASAGRRNDCNFFLSLFLLAFVKQKS